jgi:hypothetical protein
MAFLDANQVIKKSFDATKNALRVTGISGAQSGQITWSTGLGAIVHVLGPTDQNLTIRSNTSRSFVLGANGATYLTLTTGGGINLAKPIVFDTGLGAVTQVTGPTDQNLLVYAGTGRNLVLGANAAGPYLTVSTAGAQVTGALTTTTTVDVGTNITFTAASAHTITGPSDQNVSLLTAGTGITYMGSAGSATALAVLASGAVTVSTLCTLNAGLVLETTATSSTPYAVLATDHVILIDCSGGAKTVNLQAAATAGTGRRIVVKDQSGNSGANNITVTPNGTEKIDEAATAVIASNYGSLTLVCGGTAGNEWSIV